MKLLTLDLETSPNVAHVWGLFKQTVSLSQLRETSSVIAFASKWYDKSTVDFRSDFHDGHDEMILRAHHLLDECDAVVHYNGKRFDIPSIQREFVLAGLNPPSPFQQIDLLNVVRQQFRFTSNKLDHVSQQLGLGAKTAHTGHDLWVRCMGGDPKAWALMRKYNKQDVVLTEKLYDKLRPWITQHPHHGLFNGEENVCANCGSRNLQRRGFQPTMVSMFQRYQCQGCGRWSRGKTAVARVDERGTA